MIVQACLNGARPNGYHSALPVTAEAIALDAVACVDAGAAELHVHPRGHDYRESLAAVDAVVDALRAACPGTLIGVSTGAWIEADIQRTRGAIAGWRSLPDYASVNLSEPDAPAVMGLLDELGVGIEAGVATVEDVNRFISLDVPRRVLRILIEIDDQNASTAIALADDIAARLHEAGLRKPILLHGNDDMLWPLVARAREQRWSTRIGLEDGDRMPDGTVTPDNAALVSAAVALFRDLPSAGPRG